LTENGSTVVGLWVLLKKVRDGVGVLVKRVDMVAIAGGKKMLKLFFSFFFFVIG
jgi:hypothetical protein